MQFLLDAEQMGGKRQLSSNPWIVDLRYVSHRASLTHR